MTIKTLLTTFALTLASATAGFAQCGHDSASMSCAEGTVYDAATNSCNVISS